MQTIPIITTNYITVVPCYQHIAIPDEKMIRVFALQFWYNEQFQHRITDNTIKLFLSHAAIFGAIVYPDKPQMGCLAINGDWLYRNGESSVWQIHYKGSLIYCKS